MSTTSPRRQCPRTRSSGTGGIPLVSLVYLGIGDGGETLMYPPPSPPYIYNAIWLELRMEL